MSNVQSTIEVEVLRWSSSDKALNVDKKRQYLPFFIQPPEGAGENDSIIEQTDNRVFYKFIDSSET